MIRTISISKVRIETPLVRSIQFEDELCVSAKPGQFIMLWIPGIDEIPLSISSVNGIHAEVTVKIVGDATLALSQIKEGGLIGVRGPFGNHFEIIGKNSLIVGGGIGTAPLMMLLKYLLNNKVKVTVLEGAKTHLELLFLNRLKTLNEKDKARVFFATDDGSYGLKGTIPKVAEKILSSNDIDSIYVCGNESMMMKVFRIAKMLDIPLQASLERLVLCALGICGSCMIGRYRVCRDGPVFDGDKLEELNYSQCQI